MYKRQETEAGTIQSQLKPLGQGERHCIRLIRRYWKDPKLPQPLAEDCPSRGFYVYYMYYYRKVRIIQVYDLLSFSVCAVEWNVWLNKNKGKPYDQFTNTYPTCWEGFPEAQRYPVPERVTQGKRRDETTRRSKPRDYRGLMTTIAETRLPESLSLIHI